MIEFEFAAVRFRASSAIRFFPNRAGGKKEDSLLGRVAQVETPAGVRWAAVNRRGDPGAESFSHSLEARNLLGYH